MSVFAILHKLNGRSTIVKNKPQSFRNKDKTSSYQTQDVENRTLTIKTGILCIGFHGEKEKNDKEAIIVGHKIVSLLKEQGFTVEWDGSASKRIEIHDFNWQNVFTSDEDVEEKWGYDRVLVLMEE